MNGTRPSVQAWLDEIKSGPDSAGIGMLLTHNGIVRGVGRDGLAVRGMDLSYEHDRLVEAISQVESMPGVIAVRAWVNEGPLAVGDDIMYALVAGDIREHVFSALQELVRRIKTEVVTEHEIR